MYEILQKSRTTGRIFKIKWVGGVVELSSPPLLGSQFVFKNISQIAHRVYMTNKIINDRQLSSLFIKNCDVAMNTLYVETNFFLNAKPDGGYIYLVALKG